MRKPEFINYNGKTFFYMNFSQLREVDEVKGLVRQSIEYIRSQPENSVLTLSNLDGMHFNSEIKNVFSEFIKGNKPFIKASAVVGIGGLQRIIYNGIMRFTGRDVRSFENIMVAQDWLSAN